MASASRDDNSLQPTTLAETDNYLVWTARDDEGEPTFNIELGSVTLHLFQEEWDELVRLMRLAQR